MIIDPTTAPAAVTSADKPLTKLLGELTELAAQRKRAWDDRDAADRETDTASRTDTTALAGALRAGRPDPGPVAQRAAQTRYADAQRHLDALEVATDAVTEDVTTRVIDQRPALVTHADAARDKAVQALDTALAAVTAALIDLAAAQYADAWVTAVAGRRQTPRPADPTVLVVDRLGQRHHCDAAAVTAALTDLANPARGQRREQLAARSMAPGVPQNLTEEELIHGRAPLEG